MSLEAIESLLKRTMGLDAHTVGASTIHRAASERMSATGNDDVSAYYRLACESRQELDALIERVVIPETWFFRDQRPFDALQQFISEEWLLNNPGATLRILSIPCSTGEEPYSIAMILDDIGIGPADSHIDAVDISSENLCKAERGHYRKNSFRSKQLGFRDRFFTPAEDGYVLNEDIRTRVNFIQANLLEPGFMTGQPPYDVIFCRNLLIYFDRPTQDKAIATLEPLCSDTGCLFIGHAEAGLLLGNWAPSSRYQHGFVFRKSSDERRSRARPEFGVMRTRRRARTSQPQEPRAAAARPFARTAPMPAAAESAPVIKEAPAPVLAEAQQLADHGHLAEAGTLCEQHLEHHGPSTAAFYLLALVREAAGQSDEAEQLLRKAVYLEPNHVEALTHLALINERRGDQQAAQLLHQRAQRAQQRNPQGGTE